MNPGDKVICLKTFICPFTDEPQYTQGLIYEVKSVQGKTVYTVKDDLGHDDNGLNAKFFEVVQ